jgi:hypothetical protein
MEGFGCCVTEEGRINGEVGVGPCIEQGGLCRIERRGRKKKRKEKEGEREETRSKGKKGKKKKKRKDKVTRGKL